MRLTRLELSLADLASLPPLIGDDERPLVVRVTDADTVTVLAGLAGEWSGSWGVWLRFVEGDSLGPVARDLRTLGQLMELDHVVLESPGPTARYVEALASLLGGEELTVDDEVLTLRRAVSRPALRRRLTWWRVEGATLVSGERVLRPVDRRGSLTRYED
jgi:hypothetical protein